MTPVPDPAGTRGRATAQNHEGRFFVAGGAVRLDAPSYVERAADQELHEALLRMEFAYVLDTRQMGKSSLMARAAQRLRTENGYAVATIDLSGLGQGVTPDQWYDSQLIALGRSFDLQSEVEEFVDRHEKLGALDRWKRAIREVILERVHSNIVVFVDEIDYVRVLPFPADEFFAGIREFHSRRPFDAELNRLTFCLLGVATPSDLIRSTETTPFNIGRRIVLTDLSEKDSGVRVLAQGLSADEKVALPMLARVLYWTGGHPYLTQKLCEEVIKKDAAGAAAYRQDASGVDRACRQLYLVEGARAQNDNLAFVAKRLVDSADANEAISQYSRVRRGERVIGIGTDPWIDVLRLSGIVRLQDDRLVVRNRIYNDVFDQEWIIRNLTPEEVLRQREAAKRARRRTLMYAGVAGVILLLGFGLFVFRDNEQRAKLRSDLADQQRRLAVEQQRATESKQKETEAQLAVTEAQRDLERLQRSDTELKLKLLSAEATLFAQRAADMQRQQNWLISRELATKADLERRDQAGLAPRSLLLSIEALGRSSTPEAYRALVEALRVHVPVPSSDAVAVPFPDHNFSFGRLSPAKTYFALAHGNGRVCTYALRPLALGQCYDDAKGGQVAIADDGWLTVKNQADLFVCASRGQKKLEPCPGMKEPVPEDVRISDDAKHVGWLDDITGKPAIHIVDLGQGKLTTVPLDPLPPNVPAADRNDLTLARLSADGAYALVSAGDDFTWVYDLTARRQVPTPSGLGRPLLMVDSTQPRRTWVIAEFGFWRPSEDPMNAERFPPNLAIFAEPLNDMEETPWSIASVSPDGRWLGYRTQNGAALVDLHATSAFRFSGFRAISVPLGGATAFLEFVMAAVDSDGTLAVADRTGTIRLYDATGREQGTIPGPPNVGPDNMILPLSLVDRRLIVMRSKGLASSPVSGFRGVEHPSGNELRVAISPPLAGRLHLLSSRDPAELPPLRGLRIRGVPSQTDFRLPIAPEREFLVSGDGRTLAYETDDRGIGIRRLLTDRDEVKIKSEGAVSLRAISRDGRWVSLQAPRCRTGKPPCVLIADTTSGAAPVEVSIETATPTIAFVAPTAFVTLADGRTALAIVHQQGRVQLVDTAGRQIASGSTGGTYVNGTGAFSEDGSVFLGRWGTPGSTSGPGPLYLWKTRETEGQTVVLGPHVQIEKAVSARGEWAAVLTSSALMLWKAPDWSRQEHAIRGNAGATLAFDFAGEKLAISDSSGIQQVNLSTGGSSRVPQTAPLSRQRLLGYSPKGDRLLLFDGSGQLSWLNVSDGSRSMVSLDVRVPSASLAAAGTLVVMREERTVPVRFARSLDVIDPLDTGGDRPIRISIENPATSDGISAVAYGNDVFAVGDTKGRATVYDARSGIALKDLPGTGTVRSLAFNPDSSLLAVARDTDVYVCAWRSGCERKVTVAGYITSVIFARSGTDLVVATDQNVTSVYDARRLVFVRELDATRRVHALISDPTGQTLAAVGANATRLYRQADYQPLGAAPHDGRLAAFSRTGAYIALTGTKSVHILDASGKELAVLLHEEDLKGGAFSPDGSTFAAATREGVVLWSLSGTATGSSKAPFPTVGFIPVGGNAEAIAFTQDGRHMIVSRSRQADDRRGLAPDISSQTVGLTTLVFPWRAEDLISEACGRLQGLDYSDPKLAKFSVGEAWIDFCKNPTKIGQR